MLELLSHSVPVIECVVWVCWLRLSAWHKIDSSSRSIEQRLFLHHETAVSGKNLKGRPYSVFKQT